MKNLFSEFRPGAGCSKLATLVNVSLEFKMYILQIHCYFLLEKCALQKILTFFQQKITVYLII